MKRSNETPINLICSLLALTTDTNLLKKKSDDAVKVILQYEEIGFFDESFLTTPLNINKQVIKPCISETFKIVSQLEVTSLLPRDYEYSKLRQYLRKFSFYYKCYYGRHYPNNLANISNKKINMLGLKSLLNLSSL
tara:strand:+ start:170 stop:577 length:408 start_codon:yes stop_codon:yes gene_type:complete